MKKKPTRRTQSDKKRKPEVNKNALRELWLRSKDKDWLIEKLNKCETWARASEKVIEALDKRSDAKDQLAKLRVKNSRNKKWGSKKGDTFQMIRNRKNEP